MIKIENHTSEQILDFYHASGYLGAVAVALYPEDLVEQKRWRKESSHQLKWESGGAEKLYKQMYKLCESQKHGAKIEEKLEAAVTYFHNHRHQMNYAVSIPSPI